MLYPIFSSDDDFDEPGYFVEEDDGEDEEPRELPTAYASPGGPCVVCGKPEQVYACHSCGKPVCMHDDYMEDSSCGSWILDWWHPAARDDDGNEFWCSHCLEKAK